MDCKHFRQIVFRYTDNELEASEVHVFQEHLEVCPACEAEVLLARQIKILLQQRCARAVAPRSLRVRILASFPHRGAR